MKYLESIIADLEVDHLFLAKNIKCLKEQSSTEINEIETNTSIYALISAQLKYFKGVITGNMSYTLYNNLVNCINEMRFVCDITNYSKEIPHYTHVYMCAINKIPIPDTYYIIFNL